MPGTARLDTTASVATVVVTLPHHEGSLSSNHVRRELFGFAKQRRAHAREQRA